MSSSPGGLSHLPTITPKTIIVGQINSGKTSLAERFSSGKFSEQTVSTIGSAFFQKTMTINSMRVCFQIWDLAGLERQRNSITPLYYRGASICLCCVDCTSKETFDQLPEWIEEIKTRSIDLNPEINSMTFVVVVTKTDLEPTWDISLAEKYAKENEMLFCKTSSKKNVGVVELFFTIGKIVTERYKKGDFRKKAHLEDLTLKLHQKPPSPPPSGCCASHSSTNASHDLR